MNREDIKKLLQNDSKALAVTIIAYRILGLYKEEAKFCMMELMRRKQNGDTFQFEKFIKDGVDEYKIDVNMDLMGDLKKELTNSIAKDITSSIFENKED